METYLVMKNNFRRSLRHKVLFAVTFVLPVLLCILFGLIRFDKTSIRLGVLGACNVTDDVEEKQLITVLEGSAGVQYETANEATLYTDLFTGKYHAILDYRSNSTINQFELLTYQKEKKSKVLEICIREAIINKKPVILSGLKGEGMSVTKRSSALLLTLFMVFSTIYASAIIRDRQSQTLLRYRFACKSNKGYYTGYLIYVFLITFAQVLFSIGSLLLVQKKFFLDYSQGILLAIVVTTISTVFSVIICIGSRSEMQANIIAAALTSILSLLGGTFVATQSMPGLLRLISIISPIRWVLEMIG